MSPGVPILAAHGAPGPAGGEAPAPAAHGASGRAGGGQRGQATVELVALLPVVVGVVLAVFTFLAAGKARERAAQAAEAGAVALLHDGDPRAAACAALGRSPACRRGVRVRGHEVTVSVRPDGPIGRLNRQLEATESALAGPEATP